MSGRAADPLVEKLPFVTSPWWGGWDLQTGSLRGQHNSVQTEYCFLWGTRLTVIPDMSPWQRWGRGGGTDGGHQCPHSHARAPCSPLPPPGVQWGAVSSPTALGRSVQFHWRDLSECLLGAGLSLLRNTSLQENTLPLPSYGKWTQKKDLFFTLSNFTFEVYSRTYMEREVKDT